MRAVAVVAAAGTAGTARPRTVRAAVPATSATATTLATVLRAAPTSVVALPVVRLLLGGPGRARSADDPLAALNLPLQQTADGALALLDAAWPYVTPFAEQAESVKAAALAWAADTTGTIAVPDFGPILVASGAPAPVADALNDAVRSHLLLVLQSIEAAVELVDDPDAFRASRGFDDDERALLRDPAFLLGALVPVVGVGPLTAIDRQLGSPVVPALPADWRVRWSKGGRLNPITGRFS